MTRALIVSFTASAILFAAAAPHAQPARKRVLAWADVRYGDQHDSISHATAFYSWPEFGEMLGGRFDEHPWNVIDGTVVVDDPSHPAMRQMPPRAVFHDELYQLKDFSRDKIHVLAHLDASKLDLTAPLVH